MEITFGLVSNPGPLSGCGTQCAGSTVNGPRGRQLQNSLDAIVPLVPDRGRFAIREIAGDEGPQFQHRGAAALVRLDAGRGQIERDGHLTLDVGPAEPERPAECLDPAERNQIVATAEADGADEAGLAGGARSIPPRGHRRRSPQPAVCRHVGTLGDETPEGVDRDHLSNHGPSGSQRPSNTGPGDDEFVERLVAVLADGAGVVDCRCLPSRRENSLLGRPSTVTYSSSRPFDRWIISARVTWQLASPDARTENRSRSRTCNSTSTLPPDGFARCTPRSSGTIHQDYTLALCV
jgi:hypothetical protein